MSIKNNIKCAIFKPRELGNSSVKKNGYVRNSSTQIAAFFLLLDAVAYIVG